jgi:hypothetical protein
MEVRFASPPVGSAVAAWQTVMQLLNAKGRFERTAYDEACEAAGIPVEKREGLRKAFRRRGGCSISPIYVPSGGALRRSRPRKR